MRKFSDMGSNALLELQWYLFSAIFLLGAGSVLKRQGHIRIDLLYNRFSPAVKSIVNIVLHISISIPVIIFIIYLSIPFLFEAIIPAGHEYSWKNFFLYLLHSENHEISPNAGGLATWYAKILLPIGFIFLLIATTCEILVECVFLLNLMDNKYDI